MKNRRTIISLFLIVALLFLGFGYAALTNNLTINGSLNAAKNDSNLQVEFVGYKSSAKDSEGNEDTTFTVSASASGQTATIDVENISKLNQKAVVVYKVQNNSIDLESLNATLDAEFVIELGEGTKAGSTYTLTSAATDKEEDADPNTFEGTHFTVKVNYTLGTDGTGTINADGSVSLEVGQWIYVQVEVELVEVVSEELPLHVVKVTFDAVTE